MDDLVYVCTKLARQMDANGLDRVFEAAGAATSAIEEGRPLLTRAIELADEVRLWGLGKCGERGRGSGGGPSSLGEIIGELEGKIGMGKEEKRLKIFHASCLCTEEICACAMHARLVKHSDLRFAAMRYCKPSCCWGSVWPRTASCRPLTVTG